MTVRRPRGIGLRLQHDRRRAAAEAGRDLHRRDRRGAEPVDRLRRSVFPILNVIEYVKPSPACERDVHAAAADRRRRERHGLLVRERLVERRDRRRSSRGTGRASARRRRSTRLVRRDRMLHRVRRDRVADGRSLKSTRSTPLWKPVRSDSSISWKMWNAVSVGSQLREVHELLVVLRLLRLVDRRHVLGVRCSRAGRSCRPASRSRR